MASSVSRPRPTGTNKRGRQTYDGPEMGLYRRAHGVQQTHVAEFLRMPQSHVSVLLENRRTPVAQRQDRIEKYFYAVERIAARNAEDRVRAIAELAALRAGRSSAEAE